MPPLRDHDDDDSTCDSKKIMVHSRQMTRLGHMFWSAGTVMKRAKAWQRKDEAGRKALEDSASDDEIFGHFKRRKATGDCAECKGTCAALDAALEAGVGLGLGDTGEAETDEA
ncbi:hypothetical protein FRC08_007993 [Ceratobasidium sp. 394]|nr:hypothetical protein FRC08_007993 [Ceratobasidium sp. 394]KAG9076437.1 hypothetical protein FS749_011795 [Ceratobasidium sp. UAMH 11750]